MQTPRDAEAGKARKGLLRDRQLRASATQQKTDPFQWLEDGSSQRTLKWVEDQNTRARSALDAIPERDKLRQQLSDLYNVESQGVVFHASSGAARRYFQYRRSPGQNHKVLYYREEGSTTQKVAVDPNTFSSDGSISMPWAKVSPDGRMVAYATSDRGSDRAAIHVLSLDTAALLTDTIPPIRYADMVWLPDSSGFYYSKWPDPNIKADQVDNHHVYLHRLGADHKDDIPVFGAGLPARSFTEIATFGGSRHLFLTAYNGRTTVYYKDLANGTSMVPLITNISGKFDIINVVGTKIYAVTDRGAKNNKVVSVDMANPSQRNWTEVIPERVDVLNDASVVGGHIVASYLKNAHSTVLMYSLDGKFEREIKFPPMATVEGPLGMSNASEMFFRVSSFNMPPTIYGYDVKADRLDVIYQTPCAADLKNVVVDQVWYPSKDGTKVSMFLVHRNDIRLDGKNPTVLYGYGGFDDSMVPEYDAAIIPFIQKGGVYAVANIRGGGEYGQDWHMSGTREKKQNVFDDFIAAAEWLISQGYTSSGKLAVSGASNGGLLTAAVMTQRPDLFKAVICDVPVLDMLRFHRFGGGAQWISEYGNPDSSDAKYLAKYSPYENVKNGQRYPATLFTSGGNDDRVDPMHARKMVALMQALASNPEDIILRTDPKSGHGFGMALSGYIEKSVDEWSFIFQQLGMVGGTLQKVKALLRGGKKRSSGASGNPAYA